MAVWLMNRRNGNQACVQSDTQTDKQMFNHLHILLILQTAKQMNK